jgi:hypothetical protein
LSGRGDVRRAGLPRLARIGDWIARASPRDLLNVDIFYDFRPVQGDAALAATLWQEAWAVARGAFGFLKLLSQANAAQDDPFGFLGRLKTEDGRLDLKRHGLRPIVSSARLLALRHGIAVRETAERLQGILALRVGAGPPTLPPRSTLTTACSGSSCAPSSPTSRRAGSRRTASLSPSRRNMAASRGSSPICA